MVILAINYCTGYVFEVEEDIASLLLYPKPLTDSYLAGYCHHKVHSL